jgi:hypothetical protein
VNAPYLVCLVSGSRSDLALLARRKLGKIAVVITLPVVATRLASSHLQSAISLAGDSHLMVKDLGLA